MLRGKDKAPADDLTHLPGLEMVCAGLLEQIEFLSAADSRPPVGHPELVVNVAGVGPYGAQGHDEFAGDLGAAQVGSEQPKHVTLTLAERLDQGRRDAGCRMR